MAREGGDGSGEGGGRRGLMAAKSRGEEEVMMEWTRMRPSSAMLWTLCRFQHGWQMRLLIDVSTVEASCNVKMLAEGSE